MAAAVVLTATACTPPPPATVTRALRPDPAATPATTAPPSAAQKLLDEARRVVLRVRNTACLDTGSSFRVAGGLVTNRHVVAGATSVQLSDWQGQDSAARVGTISSGPDLALLSVPSQPGAPLAPADPPAGTPVWVAGYPEGDQLTLTAGTVVDTVAGAQFGLPDYILRITDKVEPGNSGGPLFDAAGDVVGVVFALETGSGDGLAMPVSTLRSWLAAPGASVAPPCTDG